MLSTSGGPPTRGRDPRNSGAMADGVRSLSRNVHGLGVALTTSHPG
jgi:hypothetical protein